MILRFLINQFTHLTRDDSVEHHIVSSNPSHDLDDTIDLDKPINLDSTPVMPTMKSDGLFK